MDMSNTSDLAQRAASTATYAGSGVAVYFGFSPGEWQVIGIVGGLVVGVLGLVVSNLLTAYFNWQRLKLDREKANEVR